MTSSMARLQGALVTLWITLAVLASAVHTQDATEAMPTGRLESFDNILEDNLVLLLEPGADLLPVMEALKEEKKRFIEFETTTRDERQFADYYIDLITRLYLHGSPKLLGQEQRQLEEQVQGSGEEAVFAEYHLAILEGLRSMSRRHIAIALSDPGPTLPHDHDEL